MHQPQTTPNVWIPHTFAGSNTAAAAAASDTSAAEGCAETTPLWSPPRSAPTPGPAAPTLAPWPAPLGPPSLAGVTPACLGPVPEPCPKPSLARVAPPGLGAAPSGLGDAAEEKFGPAGEVWGLLLKVGDGLGCVGRLGGAVEGECCRYVGRRERLPLVDASPGSWDFILPRIVLISLSFESNLQGVDVFEVKIHAFM